MTQNTYVMAIMADPDVREWQFVLSHFALSCNRCLRRNSTENQTIRMNIKLARDKFEELASTG